MASLIPGFKYDIFISYRQKDNKHDGWVTDFVNQLKGELESTFKEDISVYFDINPIDGLLETHDVDDSLKDKLNCLVFIPIISRTYCDPKSFAWEHEFKAFVEQASKDQFGLKVKLHNGNVAHRVLPVRIHELDNADIKLCESVLGGLLRGIEFIYKSAGVNRPLRSKEEKPQDNLNNTLYRDQINKFANAIKEILTGIAQYDQKPEEVKTEAFKPILTPLKSNKTIIILGSAIVLVLVILGIFLIPKLLKPVKAIEKSIAVLPFINDSRDQENNYFINGLMDEILNNLQKIRDFRVLSRTSTDQFRGTNKPTVPEIAKKLKVNYIVEGSGQKYGNTFRLRVQLIAANNEKHLWGNSYEREIKDTKDIFEIQSQVAQAIASELKATMTPEEKQLIEKPATVNLTAYDFYQRGNEELWKYYLEGNYQSLRRAEQLFKKSLDYDSTFARAYAGLAGVYLGKHYDEPNEYLSTNYLDSVLILADRALSYDDHLSEGYYFRAQYYNHNGKNEKAIIEFDKSINYNPNNWEAYSMMGDFYIWNINNGNYVKALENYYKAISINHGKELSSLLYKLANAYCFNIGIPEKAKYYCQEAFKLDGDTIAYLNFMGGLETEFGNFEKGIEFLKRSYLIDSNNIYINLFLATQYFYHTDYKESLKYYRRYIEKLKSAGQFPTGGQYEIGYAYLQNGSKKEAEFWFNEQKKLSMESIRLGLFYSTYSVDGAYYNLASLYALSGEKEKAYELLNTIEGNSIFALAMVQDIKKYNPLFKNIRNEPEFQNILKNMEAKFQAEQERVKKWLEARGEL